MKRGVTQFGRVLCSGRRCRKFKSCHLDHKKDTQKACLFLHRNVYKFNVLPAEIYSSLSPIMLFKYLYWSTPVQCPV